MKKILIDGLLTIIFVTALVTAANAQETWTVDQCIEPEDARDLLRSYGERPYMAYLTAEGTIWTTHFNPETETWSIIEVTPEAVCLRAFGIGIAPLEELEEA